MKRATKSKPRIARSNVIKATFKDRMRRQAQIEAQLREKLGPSAIGSASSFMSGGAMSPLRIRPDSWENIITGLGTHARDKRLGAIIKVPRSTNEFQFFEDLYHGDDIARTVVDVPAQEMVRQWITVSHDDEQGAPTSDKGKNINYQESQIGLPGADQISQQNTGLSVVSKNVAPATTHPIETTPHPKISRLPLNNARRDEAPAHPGPDDSIALEEDNAQEKKLLGKSVMQKLEALEAQTKVYESLVWANVFGGSLLFLGIDDGHAEDPAALAEPLDEDNIQSFDFLSVFDRWDVDVYTWYRDPRNAKFGLPESYRIRQTASAGGTDSSLAGDIVHETRVIRFDGSMVNRRRRLRNAGWADSVYIRLADVIRDFAMAWGGIAHLLQDFSQAVFKMQGLANALLQDNDNLVIKRMQMLDMARSVARAVPLDAENEEFERKETPVSGMPELLDRFALRLAAAARMPVTLLMGQSPAGLNATGDNDVRNFYDYIKSLQIKVLLPRLNRLMWLLFKDKSGPTKGKVPNNWSISFNPLWQATDLEMSTIKHNVAQTDQVYLMTGVLHPEEVAQSRFGGDRYSTETVLDTELRKQQKQAEQIMARATPDGNPAESAGKGQPGNPQPDEDPSDEKEKENPSTMMEYADPGPVNSGRRTTDETDHPLINDPEPVGLPITPMSRAETSELEHQVRMSDVFDRPIELSDLHATQPEVSKSLVQIKANSFAERDADPIIVGNLGGQNLILDGHHRVAAAMKRGDRTIMARVMKLDSAMWHRLRADALRAEGKEDEALQEDFKAMDALRRDGGPGSGPRPHGSADGETKKCTTCGKEYSPKAWNDLKLVGMQPLVDPEPGEPVALELKNCTDCGSTLAKEKFRADGGPGSGPHKSPVGLTKEQEEEHNAKNFAEGAGGKSVPAPRVQGPEGKYFDRSPDAQYEEIARQASKSGAKALKTGKSDDHRAAMGDHVGAQYSAKSSDSYKEMADQHEMAAAYHRRNI